MTVYLLAVVEEDGDFIFFGKGKNLLVSKTDRASLEMEWCDCTGGRSGKVIVW